MSKLDSAQFLAEKIRAGEAANANENSSVLWLPFWPENVRRIPHLLLRNALFSASLERKCFGKEMRLVASLEGHTVKCNEQLNQYDLDNLEMLLHLQRKQPLCSKVGFIAHEFLRQMGRGISGRDYIELNDDLTRLTRATVEIRWKKERKSYTGSLVSGFSKDDKSNMFVVSFNIDMMKLFEDGSTQIDWQQRQLLGKSTIAKWLQVFYASHDAPFAYKVRTLRDLSACTSPLNEFRRLLKTALAKLKNVGFLEDWFIDIDTDLVKVKKLKK